MIHQRQNVCLVASHARDAQAREWWRQDCHSFELHTDVGSHRADVPREQLGFLPFGWVNFNEETSKNGENTGPVFLLHLINFMLLVLSQT